MSKRSDPNTWSDPRHRAGWAGEKLAQCYLQASGWQILAERCRVGRIEMDLVAKRRHIVAFIEVKLRRTASFGSPLEAIGWSKRRDLSRAAAAWVERLGDDQVSFRFDVVGITWQPGRVLIHHVEDAFRPGWR